MRPAGVFSPYLGARVFLFLFLFSQILVSVHITNNKVDNYMDRVILDSMLKYVES